MDVVVGGSATTNYKKPQGYSKLIKTIVGALSMELCGGGQREAICFQLLSHSEVGAFGVV